MTRTTTPIIKGAELRMLRLSTRLHYHSSLGFLGHIQSRPAPEIPRVSKAHPESEEEQTISHEGASQTRGESPWWWMMINDVITSATRAP